MQQWNTGHQMPTAHSFAVPGAAYPFQVAEGGHNLSTQVQQLGVQTQNQGIVMGNMGQQTAHSFAVPGTAYPFQVAKGGYNLSTQAQQLGVQTQSQGIVMGNMGQQEVLPSPGTLIACVSLQGTASPDVFGQSSGHVVSSPNWQQVGGVQGVQSEFDSPMNQPLQQYQSATPGSCGNNAFMQSGWTNEEQQQMYVAPCLHYHSSSSGEGWSGNHNVMCHTPQINQAQSQMAQHTMTSQPTWNGNGTRWSTAARSAPRRHQRTQQGTSRDNSWWVENPSKSYKRHLRRQAAAKRRAIRHEAAAAQRYGWADAQNGPNRTYRDSSSDSSNSLGNAGPDMSYEASTAKPMEIPRCSSMPCLPDPNSQRSWSFVDDSDDDDRWSIG